jgi:hypothetical protein
MSLVAGVSECLFSVVRSSLKKKKDNRKAATTIMAMDNNAFSMSDLFRFIVFSLWWSKFAMIGY